MARLLGVDLPRNKKMSIAMRAIFGVGPKVAKDVLAVEEHRQLRRQLVGRALRRRSLGAEDERGAGEQRDE